jgi:hypothetical protein
MHALIMLIVCIITVSCTLGYVLFSKTPKSENNVFIGLSNTNRYYVSKNLHDATKAATFKCEHKRH